MYKSITDEIDYAKKDHNFSDINLYEAPYNSLSYFDTVESSCFSPEVLARHISSKYRKPVVYHYRTIRKSSYEDVIATYVDRPISEQEAIEKRRIIFEYNNNILNIDHSRAIIVGSEFRFAL